MDETDDKLMDEDLPLVVPERIGRKLAPLALAEGRLKAARRRLAAISSVAALPGSCLATRELERTARQDVAELEKALEELEPPAP